MPYTHGGDIYGDAAVELDFSVNTNRLGMPQAVRDAVMASAAAWEQYPDALCRKLRRAAAAFYEADGTPIPEDWLVIFYMQLSQRFGPNRRFCWHRDFRSMSRRFGCAAARSGGFI